MVQPNVRCIVISWYHAVLKILGKYSTTLSTPTRTTRKPRWLELYFISLDQNFTEIYPDNSNSPLTRTVLRFPWEFEFLSFYCTYTEHTTIVIIHMVFLFVSHFSCLFFIQKAKSLLTKATVQSAGKATGYYYVKYNNLKFISKKM